MPRRVWIVPAVIVFLAVSVELARYLAASGSERSDVVALLRDQARGDATAMLERLGDCDEKPACAAIVRRNARALRTDGNVRVLLMESDTSYKLSTTSGLTRVAWSDLDKDGATFVQCVAVRKSWSFIHGARVQLRGISPRIGNEASC
ncbi:hypothetical protein DSM112329_04337 [Paraconexibacter sp. AEG42_29]|uniref:General secretion pathway GspH domain-containing protein n=1 Tax=Paraconexibacter sp. AEG42_29 TaxID=2997339 RepID=A0AAU7B0N7_9ACTN